MPASLHPDMHYPGTQHPIPSITPPTGTNPGYILYLRVDYTRHDDGTISWGYNFISGIYPMGPGIGDFITQIQNNWVNDQNRITGIPIDGPVVDTPEYVIFAIDKNGLGKFNLGYQYGPVSTSCDSGDYFNYVKVRDDTGATSPCHIVYFRAKLSDSDRTDGFNLNLDIGPIDPDIRNTGHGH